jgi:hypothetical protein
VTFPGFLRRCVAWTSQVKAFRINARGRWRPSREGWCGTPETACSTVVLAQACGLSTSRRPPRGAPHPAFCDVPSPALSSGFALRATPDQPRLAPRASPTSGLVGRRRQANTPPTSRGPLNPVRPGADLIPRSGRSGPPPLGTRRSYHRLIFTHFKENILTRRSRIVAGVRTSVIRRRSI